MKYLTLSFFLFFLACNNDKKCEKFYNNYISFRMESKKVLAIESINKSIECDNSNENYRYEKINYLILLGKYKKAKKSLVELGKINSIYISELPLYGLLEML